MVRLAASEFDRALTFLGRIHAAESLDAFATASVRALSELFVADIASYNELAPSRRWAFCVAEPADILLPGVTELVGRHIADNPLAAHYERTGDRTALRLSDFVSKRAFRRTELYQAVYRPIGGEHLLVNNIGDRSSLVIGLALFRRRRDFSERERRLLDVVSPHVVDAYRAARLRTAVSPLEAALDQGELGVLVVGRAGRVLYRTNAARALLERYFGRHEDTFLPEPLGVWASSYERGTIAAPPPSFRLARNGCTLVVERMDDRAGLVLLLREWPRPLLPLDAPGLPLSPRQREVLALVGEGKSNKEAARSLGLSERTVKKQLERIYEKLGAHSRTEAVARAREAALIL